jgi:hypothetical protein
MSQGRVVSGRLGALIRSEQRRTQLRKYRLAIEAIARRYVVSARSSLALDSAALSKLKLFGI